MLHMVVCGPNEGHANIRLETVNCAVVALQQQQQQGVGVVLIEGRQKFSTARRKRSEEGIYIGSSVTAGTT